MSRSLVFRHTDACECHPSLELCATNHLLASLPIHYHSESLVIELGCHIIPHSSLFKLSLVFLHLFTYYFFVSCFPFLFFFLSSTTIGICTVHNAMPLGASCYMNFELNFELMQSQSQAHSNSTHNISYIDGGTTYAHSTNGRSNEKS